MKVVGHAPDAVRLATRVARDGRQIRVKFEAGVRIKAWTALLGAEDDMDDDEA